MYLGFLPILVCHKQDLLQTFKRETDALRQNYKSKSVSCDKLIREKSRPMRQNDKAEKFIYDKIIKEMSGFDKMIKYKNHLRQNYKRKLLHYK